MDSDSETLSPFRNLSHVGKGTHRNWDETEGQGGMLETRGQRIESDWDVVGAGEASLILSGRVVSPVVPKQSNDDT